MNREYTAPEMDVLQFSAEDIVITSLIPGEEGNPTQKW